PILRNLWMYGPDPPGERRGHSGRPDLHSQSQRARRDGQAWAALIAGRETQLPGTQLRTRITVHARMIANTAHINKRSRSWLDFPLLAIIRHSSEGCAVVYKLRGGGFVPNRTVGCELLRRSSRAHPTSRAMMLTFQS